MTYVIHDVITSPDGAQEFRIPIGQMYALPIDTVHTSNRFIGTGPTYTVFFLIYRFLIPCYIYMTTSFNFYLFPGFMDF